MLQIIHGGTIRGGELLVTNVGYHYTRKADKRPGKRQRWCCITRNRGCSDRSRVGNLLLLGHCPFGLEVTQIFKGTKASLKIEITQLI